MKLEIAWSERIPAKDNFRNVVFDLCFRPDGSQILVAVGNRVLVYDANDGDLLHSLKGHRDYVYAVAYSRDGKRFASGGADKTIIIWTSKCEGILKYSHNDSVQKLAYNPVTQQLASVTASDFGLWSPEQKSVQKFKLSAKGLCCSWTNDGQYLAIGQFNGHVSVRDKSGNEKVRIERSEPVWCLSWSPPSKLVDTPDVLAVADWSRSLSFHTLSGAKQGKDHQLTFDPCSLCYYSDGEYIIIGGSNRKVSMYTKEGVFLRVIADREDWVWTLAARPKHKYLGVGCNDGTLAVYQTVFSTVHGLYQDRYAHRDTMTDVIIQHLITEQKVRIKTRDYVKKIAVFKSRVAVQLPDRVLVYETAQQDAYDMHYKLREKVVKKLECNLLVVTSHNIILCQERRLQLYTFDGTKIREWLLEAVIRYIRVVGGPASREGLLVGLKNGSVFKIFIDNKFPVKLVKHSAPIRCLDLSASRRKLAVVDENSKVFVYNLATQEIVFEESNANSVAWNADMEDMFCYSGNGMLCIKTGDFPIHKQALQGFVVGFKGSKIFCLHYLSMQTIDVPQSASLFRYLDALNYDSAYKVGCLGVTDSDWRELATRALQGLSFEVARKAFIRVRDVRYIELLNRLEVSRKNPNHDDNVFLADVLAFQGKYAEAARLYVKAGHRKKAIEMFLDLRDWEKAKEIVEQMGADTESLDDDSGVSMIDLLKRQAQWLTEVNDHKAASEMYWAAKEFSTAIRIIGEASWLDLLMDRVHQLQETQEKELKLAAGYFKKANHVEYAKETYLKYGDHKALMELYVDNQMWDEAFAMIRMRPELAAGVYEPYAVWLAVNDRFDEAQEAYKKAGKPEQALKMLYQLTKNAVIENRYQDAGYYFWLLAQENIKSIRSKDPNKMGKRDAQQLRLFHKHYLKAEMYYAYNSIFRYHDEPFTSMEPEVLFQTAQYLMNNLYKYTPHGILKAYTLFALAKQGKSLQAYRMSREAYSQLNQLKLSPAWKEQIDMNSLTIRTKPYNDLEELQPVCHRCMQSNPLLNAQGDRCQNCGHAFVRSFCGFDTLPLVEFFLDEDIPFSEAEKLLAQEPPAKSSKSKADKDGWKNNVQSENVQTLNFGGDDGEVEEEEDADEDLFTQQLMADPNSDGNYPPIRVDRKCLMQMPQEEVFVVNWKKGSVPPRLYRSVIPEVQIAMCGNCKHFFLEEDYEFHILQKKNCPFCRQKVNAQTQGEGVDDALGGLIMA